jgi:hypothetical protein
MPDPQASERARGLVAEFGSDMYEFGSAHGIGCDISAPRDALLAYIAALEARLAAAERVAKAADRSLAHHHVAHYGGGDLPCHCEVHRAIAELAGMKPL